MIRNRALVLVGSILAAFAVHGCGDIRASGTARAELIPSPSGVTCYAIIDGGQTVGGSCIKN
jgi:hypothetical protein